MTDEQAEGQTAALFELVETIATALARPSTVLAALSFDDAHRALVAQQPDGVRLGPTEEETRAAEARPRVGHAQRFAALTLNFRKSLANLWAADQERAAKEARRAAKEARRAAKKEAAAERAPAGNPFALSSVLSPIRVNRSSRRVNRSTFGVAGVSLALSRDSFKGRVVDTVTAREVTTSLTPRLRLRLSYVDGATLRGCALRAPPSGDEPVFEERVP